MFFLCYYIHLTYVRFVVHAIILEFEDLILHIVDVSQPEWQLQVNHVEELLCNIGVIKKPTNSGHTNDSNAFEPPQVLKIGNKLDRM